jgi:hypothetical protein
MTKRKTLKQKHDEEYLCLGTINGVKTFIPKKNLPIKNKATPPTKFPPATELKKYKL